MQKKGSSISYTLNLTRFTAQQLFDLRNEGVITHQELLDEAERRIDNHLRGDRNDEETK
jgi:hypothetical protein